MMAMNRVGTLREVLPKWGVVWQTKELFRDGASAPAAPLGFFLTAATILGRAFDGWLCCHTRI